MRSIGIARRLFFINGMVPTDAERAEAGQLDGRVSFRNARLVDNDGAAALEECDSVHGAVPPRYAAAFPAAAGDAMVSGVGALRTIHDGEKGVTDNQALHLDSRPTGDPVEEERRRAYRGPAVNSPDAVKAEPGRLDPAAGWGRPAGVNGAAQLTTGEVSQIRSEQQGQAGSAGSNAGGWAPPTGQQPAQPASTSGFVAPGATGSDTTAGAGSTGNGGAPAPTA